MKKGLSALALVATWLLIWETGFRLSGKKEWQFPTPLSVIQSFSEGLAQNEFIWPLVESMKRAFVGFGMALGVGVVLGILLVGSRFAAWLMGPLVLGVQSLPSVCWQPVAVLWFGLNEKAILFIVVMGSVGSITIATRDGLSQVPMTYQRVAGTFGASYWQRLLWVYIPSALPAFCSGMKQAWSFAWRSLLAGELIQKIVGVGGLLQEARDLSNYPRMFASMILILLASIVVDKLVFGQLEKYVRGRWGM